MAEQIAGDGLLILSCSARMVCIFTTFKYKPLTAAISIDCIAPNLKHFDIKFKLARRLGHTKLLPSQKNEFKRVY